MRAGKLDREIILRRATTTTHPGTGQPIETWIDLATVRAEVMQQSGREFLAAGGIEASRVVVFRVRWIDGITVTDEVRYDGRDHNIHEVREVGRRRGLELHCVGQG